MTDDSRGNIIDKIQALLAKVPERGATEAEAASALEMAHKLLLKHNLTMAEVEEVELPGESLVVEEHESAMAADGTPRRGSAGWQGVLATSIGRHFFVRIVAQGGVLMFIGRKDNVATVRELNSWVVKQVARLALDACHEDGREARYEKTWLRSCRLGIVARINERLVELVAEQAARDVKVRALVVRYDDENKRYIRDKYGRLGRGTAFDGLHHGGYVAGREVGDRVSLSPESRQVTRGDGR